MSSEPAKIILDDAKKIIKKLDFITLKNKSILITGANGLIGSNLSACLAELSETSNCPKKTVFLCHSTSNVFSEIYTFNGSSVVYGDLSGDLKFLDELGKFDYIIHAAGYGQPGKFMADPIKTLKINTSATFALLNLLNPNGRFLFISTSELYSGLKSSPHKESEIGNTNTDHHRACYIEAKRCGEAICNSFSSNGISASSARVALAYGPGTKENDHRVINQFIQRGICEDAITLFDAGQAKRTYCYVSDTVEILWHILFHGDKSIYNVGGCSKATIASLAKMIGNSLNKPVIFPKENKDLSGAPDDVSLDMTLVREDFNKTEYQSLERGLAQTIRYQKLLYKKE
jgi:UDP-glucuronate decarboxylase